MKRRLALLLALAATGCACRYDAPCVKATPVPTPVKPSPKVDLSKLDKRPATCGTGKCG